MISASDVPACPACGSREVHPIKKSVTGPTLYACRQCGRDQTDAWAAVQPKPPAVPVIGSPGHANEDIDEIGQSNQLAGNNPTRVIVDEVDPLPLGIGAGGTLDNGSGS